MRAAFALGLLLAAAPLVAQTNVGVELDDVTDNRVSTSDTDEFQVRGGLELRVKVTGTNLEKAVAARVIVKEAKDDKGNNLLPKTPSIPDFMGREYNSGTVQVSVGQPARAASSVRLKGTVELYVPSRDSTATVKIPNALAKTDTPLADKNLKAAKMEITILSPEGYAAAQKARKITDKDIEQIRKEGKERGVSEKEIELAVGLAKAFESMDEPMQPNTVVLSGKKADFDRIYRVEILGSDGQPLNVPSRGTSTRGESSLMTINPSEAPPKNATLELMLLTDKSKMSFPFDLKVPLP